MTLIRCIELDCDEHYAQVRQPGHFVDQGISRSQLEVMQSKGENLLNIAQRCARCNDVASLKVFLEPDLVEELKRQAEDQPNPKNSATYAVAHMMVDGSGNEEFAMTWMNAFGHTQKRAGEHFLALWHMPKEGLEFEQKRLAMAQLGQVCELLQGTDKSAILQVNSTIGRSARLIREMSFYLRAFHPDAVPQVTLLSYGGEISKSSLGEDWVNYPSLFAAILEAYPPSHEMVNSQMREATGQVLQGPPIARLTGKMFEALDRWGPSGYGADVWTWSQSGHAACMEYILAGSTPTEDMMRLIASGADVNATFQVWWGTIQRAIDTAVESGDSASVGLLLANDADPTLKAIDNDSNFCRSAADWICALTDDEIAKMDQAAATKAPAGAPSKVNFHAVRTLINVYLAKKSALEAIDELSPAVPKL